MEIEMKVPFKEEDFDRIISKISSDPRFVNAEFIKKTDKLYAVGNPEPTGNAVVRLRTEGMLPRSMKKDIILSNRYYPCINPKTVFTTKIKTVTDGGYECNIENETVVQNRKEMHNCLINMGYTEYFDKSKYAIGVIVYLDRHAYHVEVERVSRDTSSGSKSVLYVEIENTEKDFNPDSVDSIIENEKSIFKELGLNPELVDKRPWVEILK